MTRRVLMCHAEYRATGGEEQSFVAESRSFAELGFEPTFYCARNSEHASGIGGALSAIFNWRAFVEMKKLLREGRPDVVYVNNTWVSLSPSVLLACRLAGVPTIQALRNYRIVAPSAKLTDTSCCFECRGKRAISCLRSGCGGGHLRALIALITAWLSRLLTLGWKGHVYVTPSDTARELLIRRGFRRRILVRPNFLAENPRRTDKARLNQVVFVGRLSREKGVLELVRSWPAADDAPRLVLVGEGQLRSEIEKTSEARGVRVTGHLAPDAVRELMAESLATVCTSTWSEPFGRVVIESLSVGTPVIVSGGGAPRAIVGDAGLVLERLEEGAIRDAIATVVSTDFSSRAKERFCAHYTLEASLQPLQRTLESIGVQTS